MTAPAGDLLVFTVDAAVYAIGAPFVREIHWLPALSPAPGASPGTVGRFNLRGEVVPVLDLALCLGRRSHRAQARDQLLVLEVEGALLGLVVSEVRDIVAAFTGLLLPEGGPRELPHHPLVAGSLQAGDDLATLLDPRGLVQAGAAAPEETGEVLPSDDTPLLRERARTLRQMAALQGEEALTLAVVDLGGHWFGIELAAVREFCQVPQLRPLPGCPPHIAGVFNLRGQLITLLEAASALNLPPPPAPRPRAVIAGHGREAVALAVDEVVDVFHPEARHLQSLPSTLEQHGPEIRAVAAFAGRRVTLLDLPGLLDPARWTVDETPT